MKTNLKIIAGLIFVSALAFTACVIDAAGDAATDEKIYKVTFDSQGATVPATPVSKMVASPATTVDALPGAPSKNGYTFLGWYSEINGGGTVFTDATIVAADITVYAKWGQPVSGYAIGDIGPSGVGIVLYVSDGGSHGLEVSPNDQSLNANWKNSATITGGTATGVGTGSANTAAMAGVLHPAAELCRQYHGGGKLDWYLPSKDELNLMYVNLKALNPNVSGFGAGFAVALYWSSSEYSAAVAWTQNLYSGTQFSNLDKINQVVHVRAVRAF